MRILVRLLSLHILVFLAAAGSAGAQEGSVRLAELRLRPGDFVRLEVRDEPQLHGDYAIDGEGQALLPLVGLVHVAGRPFEDVRQEVRAAYAKELARGEVRVTPILRIAVLGEVNRPGLVPVDPTFTLADVVASAGGLTPAADRNEIVVLRDGERVVLTTLDGLGAVKTALLSGDQVQVGRRGWLEANATVLVGAGASVLAALVTALVLR